MDPIQRVAKWISMVVVPLAVVVQIASCLDKRPKQPDAEEIAAQEAAENLRAQEYASINGRLKQAGVQNMSVLMSECKAGVVAFAEEADGSPFGVFMPDQYSADVYQAATHVSGGEILSDEQRQDTQHHCPNLWSCQRARRSRV